MQTYSATARPGGIRSAFLRAENWLDRRGRWAWLAVMVLGFILFWPVGLALLAYMIWGKQMFSRSCGMRRHNEDHASAHTKWRAAQATGNQAFDSYKAEALRRLEEEQDAFEAFLQRLRNSKDKSEFDAFMEDRARSAKAKDAAGDAAGNADDTGAARESVAKPAEATRPGEY